mmetsp:Transcript_26175/g.98540  ORF Transcript_26175/g.98540 Transcript_26175/m.98540 type:complete len:277 (+) Transcript_26175:185-1015(+)
MSRWAKRRSSAASARVARWSASALARAASCGGSDAPRGSGRGRHAKASAPNAAAGGPPSAEARSASPGSPESNSRSPTDSPRELSTRSRIGRRLADGGLGEPSLMGSGRKPWGEAPAARRDRSRLVTAPSCSRAAPALSLGSKASPLSSSPAAASASAAASAPASVSSSPPSSSSFSSSSEECVETSWMPLRPDTARSGPKRWDAVAPACALAPSGLLETMVWRLLEPRRGRGGGRTGLASARAALVAGEACPASGGAPGSARCWGAHMLATDRRG